MLCVSGSSASSQPLPQPDAEAEPVDEEAGREGWPRAFADAPAEGGPPCTDGEDVTVPCTALLNADLWRNKALDCSDALEAKASECEGALGDAEAETAGCQAELETCQAQKVYAPPDHWNGWREAVVTGMSVLAVVGFFQCGRGEGLGWCMGGSALGGGAIMASIKF